MNEEIAPDTKRSACYQVASLFWQCHIVSTNASVVVDPLKDGIRYIDDLKSKAGLSSASDGGKPAIPSANCISTNESMKTRCGARDVSHESRVVSVGRMLYRGADGL